MLALPFFASAAASSSIQYLSPGTNVNPGSTVTFFVANTGFVNPTISLLDSFPNSTIGGGNINSSGNFSWTPGPSDLGIHTITANVHDNYGNSSSASQQIVVGQAPSVLIQEIKPGNVVNYNEPVTFSTFITGFNYPTYVLSDRFVGALNTISTINNTNIDANGNFRWIPSGGDIGTHYITLTVSDIYGHNAKAEINFIVNSNTTIVLQSSMQTSTINPGQNVSFEAYVTGINYPTFSVKDDFVGSTVKSTNINNSGSFLWIPTASDVGTHNFTITATDRNGHSATAVRTITVQNTGISITGLSPSPYISLGQSVSFNVPVTGFTTPYFNISDSFNGSSILTGMINQAGFFNWTPVAKDVGTHNIKIEVIDNLGHKANTNVVINVYPDTVSAQKAQLADLQKAVDVQSKVVQTAPTKATDIGGYKYTFKTYLTLGSTGTAVTELQKRLTAEKVYTGPITGKFGAQTLAGVKKLQAKYKISQLGVVGPATRALLNK